MKMTLKRLLPLFLAALLLLGLAGCADAEQAELQKEEERNNLKEEISVDVKNDLSEVEEQLKAELDAAQEKFAEDLAGVQSGYEEKIDNLKSEYEGDIDELEQEIASLKAEFNEEIAALQAELDSVTGRLKKAGESLFGEMLTDDEEEADAEDGEEAETDEEAAEEDDEDAEEPEEEDGEDAEEPEADADADSVFAALALPEFDAEAYADLLNPLEEPAEDPYADRETFYDRREEINPEFFIAGLQYYEEIAGFGEFTSDYDGYVKKWADPIFVAVNGEYTEEDMATIERVASQLNSLGLLPEITIQEAEDEQTTTYMDFAPLPDLVDKYEWARSDNWGMFMIRWYGQPQEYQLFDALIYIATDVTNQEERNHLIQEEFIQSFGLMNDSYRYEESIFQQRWTTYQHPMEIDWLLIEMHSRPEITPGMEIDEALQILADLYLDYVAE